MYGIRSSLLHHDFDTLCRSKTGTLCLECFAAMKQRGLSWSCCTGSICLILQHLAASCINLYQMRDWDSVAALRPTLIKGLYFLFALIRRLEICTSLRVALLSDHNLCWAFLLGWCSSVNVVLPMTFIQSSRVLFCSMFERILTLARRIERIYLSCVPVIFWLGIDSSDIVLDDGILQSHMARVSRTTSFACLF